MTRAARVVIIGALALSLLTVAVGLHLFAGAGHILPGEFLSVSEVCERWGDRPLEVEAFRSAEDEEPARAAMACSLLKNRDDYVGMRGLEIGSLFGRFTGYHDSEMEPTYLIERAESNEDDSWQILFLIDHDRKATEIIVHKNCC